MFQAPRFLLATLAAFLLSVSTSYPLSWGAEPTSSTVRTETWDSSLPLDLLRKIRLPAARISDAIFDQLDDFGLFSVEAWEDGLDLSVRSQRRVFDNQDILNTWTVVDRLRVSSALPIASTEIGGGPIGFSIGLNNRLEIFNIRQTLPVNYANLKSIEDRKLELESALSSPEDEEGSFWKNPFSDPQDQARFGRFWNRLLFPSRLPLTVNALSKLDQGEVIAYSASGSVHLGPSVGWLYDNSILNASAAISVSTFLNGQFRISILKESERFVRVKLTRTGSYGAGSSASAKLDPTFMDGHIVIKKLGNYIKVTPFSLNASLEQIRTFDVGYRYDLENAQAREAYEQAVLGQFSYSDELAVDASGLPLNSALTGVQKIFTRNGTGTAERIRQHFRLGAIFRMDHTTSRQTMDAVITFPDGTYRIFQSWVENSREWRTFWAWYEKLYYKFLVHMDTQNRDPGFPLSLWAEGNIQDSSTTREEMMAYILETENTIGKVGVIPRPPRAQGLMATGLETDEELSTRNAWRSSFFYRVAFNGRQVESLVHTPEGKAWELLEKAYQVSPGSWSSGWGRFWRRLGGELVNILTYPLYITDVPLRLGNIQGHAARMHKRWMNVKNAPNAQEMATRLGHMFYDRRYSYELMRLLRASMDGQPVAYEVSAYSPIFGRIAETGNSQVFLNDLATRAQREVDFDREDGRTPTQGREASINGLNNRVISANRVDLQLHLKSVPKAIFIELYESDFWKWKKRANILVYNSGELQAGPNLLALDSRQSESSWFGIAKELKGRTRYRVRLAVNITGLSWGPAATTEFTTP